MTYNFTEYSNAYVLGNLESYDIIKMKQLLNTFNDSIIIYSGDFNLGFSEDKDLDKLESFEYTLSKNNNYLLFIRGENDNSEIFKARSEFIYNLNDVSMHVFIIPDYSIINLLSHKILCIGGAREFHKIHNNAKHNSIQKTRKSFPSDIDIIISHAAPLYAYPVNMTEDFKHYDSPVINAYSMYDKTLKTDIYKNRMILSNVRNSLLNAKKWIYGHYYTSHKETIDNIEYISLKQEEIYKI